MICKFFDICLESRCFAYLFATSTIMNVIFIFQRYIITSYINVKKLLKFDFYFITTDY